MVATVQLVKAAMPGIHGRKVLWPRTRAAAHVGEHIHRIIIKFTKYLKQELHLVAHDCNPRTKEIGGGRKIRSSRSSLAMFSI